MLDRARRIWRIESHYENQTNPLGIGGIRLYQFPLRAKVAGADPGD
jgi:hypothetical protein